LTLEGLISVYNRKFIKKLLTYIFCSGKDKFKFKIEMHS
jgi:hypothetical protein